MNTQTSRMRIHFVDSSDEGASHEAAMEVGSPRDDGAASVASSARAAATAASAAAAAARQPYSGSGGVGEESESREGAHRVRGGGWLSSALYRGVNAATGLLLGPSSSAPHEPYGPGGGGGESSSNTHRSLRGQARAGGGGAGGGGAGSASSVGDGRVPHQRNRHTGRQSTSSGGSWEFGSSRHRTSTESTPPLTETASLQEAGNTMDDAGEYDEVSINLKDTVLLFMQTGSDVFMNIILATLKTSDERVDGETFEIISGSPSLLKVFLDSGHVDIGDVHVQSVVQAKLDEVLSADPYEGHVIAGDLLDYVRCLCNVPTSRITFQQMVLLRYSGFDYIELLIDFPYLLENVEKPSFCMRLVFVVLHYLSIVASWLGVVVTTAFTALVLWSVVFWFERPENRNNGYWIIITYVGGYVVSLVVTMRVEEGKIKRYDNQQWHYPDNNFRIFPIIPVYEVMLSYALLRYEMSADAKRFFIIRHDLRNGSLVQHITNGFFYAMPQIVVQTFLFRSEHDYPHENSAGVCYWLLLGFACAMMLMSIFAFYRIALFSHSCNDRGFALLSTQAGVTSSGSAKLLSRRVRPSGIATKVFVFFTTYFFVAEAVTLFVCLLNLYSCGSNAIVFLSIYVGILGVNIIVFLVMYLFVPFSRLMGLVCVPMVGMETAFFIFMHIENTDRSCILFRYNFSGWVIPSIACYGAMCVSLLVWIWVQLLEGLRGIRVTQRAVDHYILA